MSTVHISGSDVVVLVGTTAIAFEDFSLSIEDGVQPKYTRGVPNGHVNGKVSASGEIVVDTENFNLLIGMAKDAGSFQEIPPFDLTGLGKTLNQELKVAAYGCKIKIADLLKLNPEGGENLKHNIPFEVTDKRFVDINGVPYLNRSRTDSI